MRATCFVRRDSTFFISSRPLFNSLHCVRLSSCLSGHFLGSFAGPSSSAHPVNLVAFQEFVLNLLLFTLLALPLGGFILSWGLQLPTVCPRAYLPPRPFQLQFQISTASSMLNPCGSLTDTLKQYVQERTDYPPTTCSFYCVPCFKKWHFSFILFPSQTPISHLRHISDIIHDISNQSPSPTDSTFSVSLDSIYFFLFSSPPSLSLPGRSQTAHNPFPSL